MVDGQAMEEVVVDGQVMVSIFDKQIILRHRYQLNTIYDNGLE